ncbi:MAG: hydrogenase iron-sulfur subunit [Candidatus Thermoplasmatota archaeon]|nr:hydrogenase iron-sulfur subunit [Euryarchaeota archaeon]MBU4032604.1 hydrogenase iron-sulfur subunit [Candidatus Thermoplasmatota archaeon]MBU4143673.1 hydrogenase iron-sulfur subunit [Candidatus Thermoplasmatota archaeon]MBU4591475.1 hydrogenase iron-sulfur subunit [Candidatus Thermoplasmatota archaeon]
MSDFEPKILGFLCNWCSYAGADLAGVSRVQYPTNIRVIRVMCSGRVDPNFILKAFEMGIDGVIVLGCHIGDCHYQSGNHQAEKKIELTSQVLGEIGLQPERLHLDWVSAAEGQRFGEIVTEFTNKIKELGPIANIDDYQKKAKLGGSIVDVSRLRWLVGKEHEIFEKGNVYKEQIDQDEYKDIIWQNVGAEYTKELICSAMADGPRKIRDIAEELALPKKLVFDYVTEMENQGRIHLVGFDGNIPSYTLSEGGGE